MFRTFAAASLLALACAMPLQQAAAQDAIGGGIFGGVVGGLLGGAVGGRGGAVAGAIIGGTTGAAIGAEGQRRREGYYWYRSGCYMQRPDGAYVAVPPDYCAPPPAAYGPPPGAYGPAAAADDEDVDYIQPGAPRAVSADAAAACARKYRSYDPRSGTFLSNDGMRKPCP
jgi:BA14K-like protein